MDWILPIAATTIISAIAWLLSRKDEAQAKQIALLFLKHDEDAKALQDLRIQIASNHYVKQELDARFDKLEAAFRDGFRELGGKLDQMIQRMPPHEH